MNLRWYGGQYKEVIIYPPGAVVNNDARKNIVAIPSCPEEGPGSIFAVLSNSGGS